MLLCEVALGDSQEIDRNTEIYNTPFDSNKYQSRKVRGQKIPDPQYTILRNTGVQMPLGQLILNKQPACDPLCRSTYNEYIVFDESQIALRYLVQFRR